MSADLWEAFGNGEDATRNPWTRLSPTKTSTNTSRTTEEPLIPISEAAEPPLPGSANIQSPWGAETNFSPINLSVAHQQTVVLPKATTNDDRTGWHRETIEDEGWSDFAKPDEPIDPWATIATNKKSSDVFWDAENPDDGEDDFGDFEDPANGIVLGLSNVSLNKSSTVKSYRDGQLPVTRGRNESEKNLPARLQRSTNPKVVKLLPIDKPKAIPKIHPKNHVTLLDDTEQIAADEEWDEWSPDPKTETNFSQPIKPTPKTISKASHARTPSSSSTAQPIQEPTRRSSSKPRLPPASTLPPTNIPPPSILISLLTSLISTLPSQIETALQTYTSTVSSSSSTSQATALTTAINSCLASLRVSSRIVTGRKNRWKRDQLLSQSMRIGPAAAGSSKSGMKLSGVDRNELKREDREVAELVRVWTAELGRVRRALVGVQARIAESAAATAMNDNSGSGSGDASSRAKGKSKKLELPSISEGLAIKTLKADDGGVPSTKACALCGLKRDERIDRVDGDVFDGFEEWWVDHWGHAECRSFWYQHERYLSQR